MRILCIFRLAEFYHSSCHGHCYLRNKNIRVILINLPYHPDLLEFSPYQYELNLAEYDRLYSQIAETYGATFINHRKYTSLAFKDFGDDLHLSIENAEIYALEVQKMIWPNE